MLYFGESVGREVQIGGPDVVSYSEMMDRMAITLGKRPRRKLPAPFITPWLPTAIRKIEPAIVIRSAHREQDQQDARGFKN